MPRVDAHDAYDKEYDLAGWVASMSCKQSALGIIGHPSPGSLSLPIRTHLHSPEQENNVYTLEQYVLHQRDVLLIIERVQ